MLVTLSVCASHFDLVISNMPEGESSLLDDASEIDDKPEESRRSGGESMRFDRYDAPSLLLLILGAGVILLPVLLT